MRETINAKQVLHHFLFLYFFLVFHILPVLSPLFLSFFSHSPFSISFRFPCTHLTTVLVSDCNEMITLEQQASIVRMRF